MRTLIGQRVFGTRESWSCSRRVVAKAEQTGDKCSPRFIVTSLTVSDLPARELYEDLYRARGECENRITLRKEIIGSG